ncbi:AMIN domain-containing protein [Desulfobotulus sp. H1]|uniref:AMIN domain-containing protein n=1 Tax=Desulfobotulus pelophilus TaxID=2823377 RepID=A0ABT3N7D3_9BACT|nr:AMIN domain-containing protein [Desulfobotulus pelophilus]MCW7753369.1 AMIN domain-containing protein [Desulfobotulus pelophilus]
MLRWGFGLAGILLIVLWGVILGLQVMGSQKDPRAILETDAHQSSGRYVLVFPEEEKGVPGAVAAADVSENLVSSSDSEKEKRDVFAAGDGDPGEQPESAAIGFPESLEEVQSDVALPVTIEAAGKNTFPSVTGAAAVERKKEDSAVQPLLKEIRVEEGKQTVRILIDAGASIHDSKAFTLEKPRRIVLDLAGMGSRFKTEQSLDIASEAVIRIRHYSSGEKTRVVLDLREDWKGSFRTEVTGFGMHVLLEDGLF